MQPNSNNILNNSQIEKLGNLAIFFADNTIELSKTKLLKLVYLCEEFFVKKYATPFVGVPFEAWQYGPVQQELYANLNGLEEAKCTLSNYITYYKDGDKSYISKLKDFDDSEFSDDEINIMSQVASNYKYNSASELIYITHKKNSLWYKTVLKEEGLMDKFESKKQETSNLILDFSDLLESDKAKEFYHSQMQMAQFANSLKL